MSLPKITIYSTLSRRKETVTPLRSGKISMYVCGMTVYDYCHLGHARVVCFFDSAVRYMRSLGYEVRLVRNITDVDDKIFARAKQMNVAFTNLTDTFITAMHEDFAQLGLLPPDDEPRATEYIEQIIALIKRLVARDYAYATERGDVYYRVRKYTGYGKLSGKKTDDLLTGVRIEPDENKEYPLDFALWKSAKENESSWSSPWGKGRPGWHIECSAMATDILGNDFDIHGGGPDLVFPHHENEIAQTCAAYDCNYASYWMHVAPLRVANEKMSKSLGNFFTIRELLQDFPAEHIRFFLARTHYRTPIQFDRQLIVEAGNALDRIYQSMKDCNPDAKQQPDAAIREQEAIFHQAMQDDFNTPRAIAALFALARISNSNASCAAAAVHMLQKLARSIGLLQHGARDYFTTPSAHNSADENYIIDLLNQRNAARNSGNFSQADSIREQLRKHGIVLEDSETGTQWKRVTH